MLYGSCARGDFDSESDIDIMIIVNCKREEVGRYRKQISKVASRIGLEQAERCIKSAKILAVDDDYKGAATEN